MAAAVVVVAVVAAEVVEVEVEVEVVLSVQFFGQCMRMRCRHGDHLSLWPPLLSLMFF